MPRLIHLNGPPAIGKSTLARRYADDHPGTLCCDVDVLRTLVGGWADDFVGAGGLIRPAALGMIGGYLASGHDVVLPQLLSQVPELELFEAAALDAGAGFVEVVLMDSMASAVSRFEDRAVRDTGDPWHRQVTSAVAAAGGRDALVATYERLERVLEQRPDAIVVTSIDGAVEATYERLLDVLR